MNEPEHEVRLQGYDPGARGCSLSDCLLCLGYRAGFVDGALQNGKHERSFGGELLGVLFL